MNWTVTDHADLPGKARIFSKYLGRWLIIVASQYEGDRYGFAGSRGRSFRLTIVRNPKEPT